MHKSLGEVAGSVLLGRSLSTAKAHSATHEADIDGIVVLKGWLVDNPLQSASRAIPYYLGAARRTLTVLQTHTWLQSGKAEVAEVRRVTSRFWAVHLEKDAQVSTCLHAQRIRTISCFLSAWHAS